MMKSKKFWFAASVVALSFFSTWADAVKVKAKGTAPYSLGAFSSVRKDAVENAKMNAVKKYAADFDAPRYKIFEQGFGQIEANIDQYVMNYELIDSDKNKKTKQYEVWIEASVNVSEINRLIQKLSPKSAGNQEAPYITLLMVGREPENRKSFKAKKTDVAQSVQSGTSEESVTGNGASFHNEEIASSTTGGSVEHKADQVKYRTFTVTDVDAALAEVFSEAGYEVVDPLDAELDVQMFKIEFSAGADITASSRREALAQCRDLEISFFGIGYMDVGMAQIDPVSGMNQVFVKVSAKITDLRKRLPKTVASVRGVQFSGLGPTPEVARQNALNAAAKAGAEDLVGQLRSKGVMAN